MGWPPFDVSSKGLARTVRLEYNSGHASTVEQTRCRPGAGRRDACASRERAGTGPHLQQRRHRDWLTPVRWTMRALPWADRRERLGHQPAAPAIPEAALGRRLAAGD